jgi:hypothetical protein
MMRRHPNLNITVPGVTPCPTGPTKKTISCCVNIPPKKRILSLHLLNSAHRRRLSLSLPPRLRATRRRCRDGLNFPKRRDLARASSSLCSLCSPAPLPRVAVCSFFLWSRPGNCCRWDKALQAARPGKRQCLPHPRCLPLRLLHCPPRHPSRNPRPRQPPPRCLRLPPYFRPPPHPPLPYCPPPRRPPPPMQRRGRLPIPARPLPEKARPQAPGHPLQAETTVWYPTPLPSNPLLPPLPNPL